MGTKGRVPSDPKAKRAYLQAQADLSQTEADQGRAAVRAAQKQRLRAKQEAKDAEMQAEAKAEQAAEKREIDDAHRAAVSLRMRTPLSEADLKKLERYEAQANAAGNPHPVMMRELRELRLRAKIKDEKKAEKKEQ